MVDSKILRARYQLTTSRNSGSYRQTPPCKVWIGGRGGRDASTRSRCHDRGPLLLLLPLLLLRGDCLPTCSAAECSTLVLREEGVRVGKGSCMTGRMRPSG